MKICSIDIQGSEAMLCLLSMDSGLFNVHDCRQIRIPLQHDNDAEKMRKFQFTISKLLEDYQINNVVIRERLKKGKFAGSAVGFKIEAAIQLIESANVEILSSQEIKEQLKKNPLPIDAREAGLKKFQEAAFQTGYAWLNKKAFSKAD
ncbi:DUF3010 family protein [Sansalvadorimonas sp. 2012CJ34-2]|uniref:DUF3010 family protein n=1 Tax=Parendozoicomonas callyspongiae TaxID=2942213 RepID=A0ABT0PLU9_9GAMM|nr:DUF3010 family protein [Sansalvadorimonas sp. 2012CJ34-2]MCL6271423.1 DUF3010 family protein [Sansalvadorimonas sp. 2012CJ34-2]